jgi:hypothetical protein
MAGNKPLGSLRPRPDGKRRPVGRLKMPAAGATMNRNPSPRGMKMDAATHKPSTNGHTDQRNGHTPVNRLAGVLPPLTAVSHGEPVEVGANAAPEAKPPEGRTAAGTFAAGNKCARGNPTARRMAALRSAMLNSLTPEKMAALGDRLYDLSLAGDLAAAKLLLAYAVGKAPEAVDPDRLDLDEFQLLARRPDVDELRDALRKKDAGLAAELAASFPEDAEALLVDLFKHLQAKLRAARGPFADLDDEDDDLDEGEDE